MGASKEPDKNQKTNCGSQNHAKGKSCEINDFVINRRTFTLKLENTLSVRRKRSTSVAMPPNSTKLRILQRTTYQWVCCRGKAKDRMATGVIKPQL